MNEQSADNNNANTEENRYNGGDKPRQQVNHPVNKAGIEEDTSAIYLTADSTLQSPAEFKTDKEGDHSAEDDAITISSNDEGTSTAPSLAGDQSAELAGGDEEDTNLNKGLEDQEIEKY